MSFHAFPVPNSSRKAWWGAPAVLKRVYSQISAGTIYLRLEVWRTASLEQLFKKSLNGGQGWFDAFSFTHHLKNNMFGDWSWFGSVSFMNPSRKARWSLGLVRSMFLYESFKKCNRDAWPVSTSHPLLHKNIYSWSDLGCIAHCQLALGCLEMMESILMLYVSVLLYTSCKKSSIGG